MQAQETRKTGKPKTFAEESAAMPAREPAIQQRYNDISRERKPVSRSWLEKIPTISLYILAGLFPLWFLPFGQDVVAYQKQILLFLTTFAGLIAWLAQSVQAGTFQLRRSWLYLGLGTVVAVVGVSAAVSLWPYASWWGFPLSVADNVATLIAFSVFALLMLNNARDLAHLAKLFSVFVWSSALAAGFAALQIFGVYILPFAFARAAGFNTIGSVGSVAILSAILVPVALALSAMAVGWRRTMLRLATLVFVGMILLANMTNAWIVLLAGALTLLAFNMWNAAKRGSAMTSVVPMMLVAIALFFIMFRVVLPGAARVPVEVFPSIGAEIEIAKQVLSKDPILGTGPGTFQIAYAKHHSPLLNETVFWGARFTSGAGEAFDWLVTKGILGFVALLSFIGLVGYFGVRVLLSQADVSSWNMGIGVYSAFAASVVALFLNPATLVFWLLFWMLAATIGFLSSKGTKTVDMSPSSPLALAGMFGFLIVFVFGLGFVFVQGQKYVAEVQYARGVNAFGRGNLEKASALLVAATMMNANADVYWRDLAQVYLARANAVSQDAPMTDETKKQLQEFVLGATAAAKQATIVAPANVANWNVQGFVFASLIGIEGAETAATQSYQKAIELEPASPFARTELARSYMLSGKTLAEKDEAKSAEAYNNALTYLAKAIELKPDYAAAHFLMATVYDEQGKTEEAAKKLEDAKNTNPLNAGIAFQLGVVYWQKGSLAKAQAELERAKSLNPQYMNARYILGLVYDKQGKISQALEEFRVIAQSNPNDGEIAKIIANLEEGRSALAGIAPAQPPISETPPEISANDADKTVLPETGKSPKK